MNTKHTVMFAIAGLIAVTVFIMPFMPIRDMEEHPAVAGLQKPAVEPTAEVESQATDDPIEMSPETREAVARGRIRFGPVTAKRREQIEWRLDDIAYEREKAIEGLASMEDMVVTQEERMADPPEPEPSWRQDPINSDLYSRLLASDPQQAEEFAQFMDESDARQEMLAEGDVEIDHMAYDARDQLQRKLEMLDTEEAVLRAELGE